MRDLIVSVPDHCLSFYFGTIMGNVGYSISSEIAKYMKIGYRQLNL